MSRPDPNSKLSNLMLVAASRGMDQDVRRLLNQGAPFGRDWVSVGSRTRDGDGATFSRNSHPLAFVTNTNFFRFSSVAALCIWPPLAAIAT